MNDRRLPPELSRALDSVAECTTSLVTALREGDAVGMERALQRRGDAIESLAEPLRTFVEGDPASRAGLLAEEKAKLDLAADHAMSELLQTVGQIRETLATTERDAEAFRRYSDRSARAVGLDRSG